MKIALQARTIDALLGGGFEPGIITEIYGEAGSGKTNICLQLGRNIVRSGKKVAYIDTEGVSMERLRQICGDETDDLMRNFLIFKPLSQEAMGRDIVGLEKLPDIGLIIVDSINMYARLAFSEESGYDNSLQRQVIHLQILARRMNIPVILTAQVYGTGEEVQPFSGRTMAHIAKTIIRLDKTGIGLRKAVIIKHRSAAEYNEAEFQIIGSGVA